MNERNDEQRAAAALERAVAELPRELPPSRDLWPDIAAAIGRPAEPAQTPPARARDWRLPMAIAAAVGLVVATAITTLWISAQSTPGLPVAATAPDPEPTPPADALEAAPGTRLPTDYLVARAELTGALEYSLPGLAPETREVVERNLREIRSALQQIDAALGRDPGNEGLQRLLLATSQQELRYLNDVHRLAETVDWNRDI